MQKNKIIFGFKEIAIQPTLRQFTKSANIENTQTKRKSHFLPAFCIKSAKPETEQPYKHQQTHDRKNAMRLEKCNRIHWRFWYQINDTENKYFWILARHLALSMIQKECIAMWVLIKYQYIFETFSLSRCLWKFSQICYNIIKIQKEMKNLKRFSNARYWSTHGRMRRSKH